MRPTVIRKRPIVPTPRSENFKENRVCFFLGSVSCKYWLASGSNESTIHVHDLSNMLGTQRVTLLEVKKLHGLLCLFVHSLFRDQNLFPFCKAHQPQTWSCYEVQVWIHSLHSDFDRQLIYVLNALSPTSPTLPTPPHCRPIVISYLWGVGLKRKFLTERVINIIQNSVRRIGPYARIITVDFRLLVPSLINRRLYRPHKRRRNAQKNTLLERKGQTLDSTCFSLVASSSQCFFPSCSLIFS